MKKDRFNMISVRLREKLEKIGFFNDEIFPDGCFDRADRYYLDISTDGGSISYITKDRLSRFGDGNFWDTDLRRKFAIKARPGRVMQTVHGDSLTYAQQRKIRFILSDFTDYEIQVVEKDDIAKYYNEDNYDEHGGDLGSSCMRYCPSSLFEFYKKYCKLIVVMRKSTEKIVARSVFFPEIHSANGYEPVSAMGRIYATDDVFFDMLKTYGIENGYYIFNGGYSATEFIIGEDEYKTLEEYRQYFVTDKLINDEFAFLPYIDNFEYSLKLRSGATIITPDIEYHPDRDEKEFWRGNQDTEGLAGYSYGDDYCEACSFPCKDCWKASHGGWTPEIDDPCFDCYGEDCEDCCYN